MGYLIRLKQLNYQSSLVHQDRFQDLPIIRAQLLEHRYRNLLGIMDAMDDQLDEKLMFPSRLACLHA